MSTSWLRNFFMAQALGLELPVSELHVVVATGVMTQSVLLPSVSSSSQPNPPGRLAPLGPPLQSFLDSLWSRMVVGFSKTVASGAVAARNSHLEMVSRTTDAF